MILTVGNNKVDKHNNVSVSLQYDSVGSSFSFDYYFNPNNTLHREIFKPCSYQLCTLEHDGELLITGSAMSTGFADSAQKSLTSISGYSKPGVLEDCEIPNSLYPLQSNGLSLVKIAERLCAPFGVSVKVDSSVTESASQPYNVTTASDSSSVAGYIAELASQKNIIVTHDEKGNLLLTSASQAKAPIFDFIKGMPGISMSLAVDGRKMHNEITIQKQATKGGKGSAGTGIISNPYCSTFRPKTNRQTSSENVDTAKAVRNVLSDELTGIALTINIDRWKLNGKIVRPNNFITVQNPDLFLFNITKFFIRSVDFSGNESEQVASLNCVLPEVFTGEVPKNIFL